MSESGVFSAVGLAPELSWRTAPIFNITGAKYGIGSANSALRFNTVEPGGGLIGKPTIVTPDNEIDGDIQLIRTIKTAMAYNGGFSFKADGENLYYYLLGMFGRDVQSQVQTANSTISANMFNHVFTPNKYFNSYLAEEDFGSGDYGRVSTGAVVTGLNLSFGAILMAQATVIPYRQVPNNYPDGSNILTDYTFGGLGYTKIPNQMGGDGTKTWIKTASPVYVDVQQEQPTIKYGNGPFVFAGITNGLVGGTFTNTYMTVDDVAYSAMELLEGFTLNMSRKFDSQMVAGSGFDPGACTGSQMSFSGKFVINFKDTTVQLAALRHSKIGLNFQIVGVTPGYGAGLLPYILDVYLPNCRFTVPNGPDLADGPITVGGDWVARRDPVLGYACRITLRNTFDNRQMGGNYPLNPTYATLTGPTAVGTATAPFTNASNVAIGDQHSFLETGVNSSNPVTLTVLSVNYSTNLVTYTTNVGFIFTVAAAVTKVKGSGALGWSNF